MSIQFAMMGMAIAGGVMSGMAKANADRQQAQGLSDQAGMNILKASEARLNASEQEQSMWNKALGMLSTNEAQIGVKGVTSDAGTSGAVIQKHNIDAANTQAQRIRFMGETNAETLNFNASEDYKASEFMNAQAPLDFMTSVLSGAAGGMSKMSMGNK